MDYNILIIDDNDNNRFSIKALLESQSAQLFEAENGREALAVLIEEKIDLIIMDVQLPDYNGFQLAKIVNSRKKTSSIPIILASAVFKAQVFMEQGFEVGAADYILKPINGPILLSKVEYYRKNSEEKEKLSETIHEKELRIDELNQEIKLKEIMLNVLSEEGLCLIRLYGEGLEYTNESLNENLQKMSMQLEDQYVDGLFELTKFSQENTIQTLTGLGGNKYLVKTRLISTGTKQKVLLTVRQL